MRRSTIRIAALLACLWLGGACDSGIGDLPDPRCCDLVYSMWCERYAECDPISFSRSWRDVADCTTEQRTACETGTDAEHLCRGRTHEQTDACLDALGTAICDDLFGSAGLPDACTPL